MKKAITYILISLFTITSLSGCNSTKTTDSSTTQNKITQNNDIDKERLSIVATTFPQYDWTRQILGDKINEVDLTLLLDNGVDLHSYQPTVDDIAKISNSDLFIYVGGESDIWVHDALKTAKNKDIKAINMMDVLGDKVKEEEIIEGMEAEHNHEHNHEHEEIDPSNIKDRPLSDWAGSWSTIESALKDGALDEFIKHNAVENEVSFEEQKAEYEKRWKTDYSGFTITDKSIEFNGTPLNYNYVGYKLVGDGENTSVWYGFELEGTDTNAPKYVAFFDHGIGEENTESHEEGVPHYHFRYGNDSFEALATMEGWAPTYFISTANTSEIAEVMNGHTHSEENELDEHVWLSIKNAQIISSKIASDLKIVDSQNASLYTKNLENYIEQLNKLDTEYKSVVDNAKIKTLLFGDRFPFRYMVDDYGLDYYGAFTGCSAETEASFETVVFLANKVNELSLNNIIVIDGSNDSIAKTISENTDNKNQKILKLDSMQSIKDKDIIDGKTYLSIMEENLKVLKDALS